MTLLEKDKGAFLWSPEDGLGWIQVFAEKGMIHEVVYMPTEEDIRRIGREYRFDPTKLLEMVQTRRPDIHGIILDVDQHRLEYGTDDPVLEQYKYYRLLIVGSEAELREALNAGWDRRDVISPDIIFLEGRRFKTAHITFSALAKASRYFMENLASASVIQDARISVGLIQNAPR